MSTSSHRSALAVGQRLLVVASTNALSCDRTLQRDLIDWFDREGLWPVASPLEAEFLRATNVSCRDDIAYSWGVEHVFVLGWALGLTDEALDPLSQASAGAIFEQIPAPGDSTLHFLKTTSLRDAAQIQHAAQRMFDAHASCRAARHSGQAERHGYDIEVAQERHRALNWLIGYEGADWDQVRTDT